MSGGADLVREVGDLHHGVLVRRLCDEGAGLAAAHDEPVVDQTMQGLVHRHARGARERGQFVLGGNFHARRPAPFQNRLLERAADLLVERSATIEFQSGLHRLLREAAHDGGKARARCVARGMAAL